VYFCTLKITSDMQKTACHYKKRLSKAKEFR